jgi:pimeloyl-ACP methyl ester carboxylesterase
MGSSNDLHGDTVACDSEPVVLTTDAGVDFVRTPDSCFDALPDWPYEPRYVEIDGLRQAYVAEGPADGPVVLLLHGQPSWSYLYRKMIPVLADGGYRVIAMDHLGMGRSDKPIDIASYSYLGHSDRLERFIEALALRNINLFVQDWGSLIGMRVAGLNLEWFARIAVGNGVLPVIPEGVQPFPTVENPDEVAEIPSPFARFPAQQVPFYDGCDLLIPREDNSYFGEWMIYAMTAESFHPAEVLEASTWFDLPDEVEAAYDAPFPSRIYMAGPRVFPSLINEVPGQTEQAWDALGTFQRPFLTLWAANDPGDQGSCEAQEAWIEHVPGAAGQPHDRLPEAGHFLQDDQGEEIAGRLVDFYATETSLPMTRGDRYCEIVLLFQNGTLIEGEIWGTQGVNECPAVSWDALDSAEIQTETGALAVIMNGPRLVLPNSGVEPGGGSGSSDRRFFGDLEMAFKGTLEIDPADIAPEQESLAYVETIARRTATFIFDDGEEIYELFSPDGAVYVMKSVSQIVDPDLTLEDLPTLGSRLALPSGWSYAPRMLTEQFLLVAEGEMINLQDDLQNTYQRVTENDPSEPTLDEFFFAGAVANTAGAKDSFWVTDVIINNSGTSLVSYVFFWLPRGEDNSEPATSGMFTLSAGRSVVYSDVLSSVFGLGDGAVGSILMAANSSDLVFMTRTYNQTEVGTYGQGMYGMTTEDLITAGQRRRLVYFVQNEAFRSNLGLLNATAAPISIRWEGFTADGTLVCAGSVELPPLGNTQVNRVFADEAPVLGAYVDVWTETPGGAFTAYGSLVDNGTSDPTTILPR